MTLRAHERAAQATSLVAELEAISGRANVLREPGARAYGGDASLERGRAELVVFPCTAPEVQAVVRAAAAAGTVIVPRGAGTGYAGGATPSPGELVVATARLRGPPVVDPERGLVRAPAGAVAADVDAALRTIGDFLPQLPSSAAIASIGGCVATCAGGSHSFGYGSIGAAVHAVEYVDAVGERRLVAADDDAAALESLVGSEGTLGVIIATVLRGEPLPHWRRALRVGFDDPDAALDAVHAIVGIGSAVTALDLTMPALLPSGERIGPAYLYVDVHAGDANDGAAALYELEQAVRRHAGTAMTISSDALGRVRLDDAIEKVRQVGDRTGVRRYFLFDAGVALADLRPVLAQIRGLAAEHGLPLANSFHAGDGTLHPAPFFSDEVPGAVATVRRFWSEVLTVVAEHRGALSGEHGIGLEKVGEVPKFHSAGARELLREVRAVAPRGARFNVRKGGGTGHDDAGRPDAPLPRRLGFNVARGLADVPRGSSLGALFSGAEAAGVAVGWCPVGACADDDVVMTVLRGWPSDGCRGGWRMRDRLLGFWFATSSGPAYLGSDVRKDVANYGLRRAVATGGWERREVLAVRLATAPPAGVALTVAAEPWSLGPPLQFGLERATRRLGAGFAVVDEGGRRLRFAARGTGAALAAALDAAWTAPIAVAPAEYIALARAAGGSQPERLPGGALDAVWQAVRAGATAWFVPAAAEWVVT